MLRTVHLFALMLATVIVGSLSVSGAKIAVGGQADTVVSGSSGVTSELSISSPYFEETGRWLNSHPDLVCVETPVTGKRPSTLTKSENMSNKNPYQFVIDRDYLH